MSPIVERMAKLGKDVLHAQGITDMADIRLVETVLGSTGKNIHTSKKAKSANSSSLVGIQESFTVDTHFSSIHPCIHPGIHPPTHRAKAQRRTIIHVHAHMRLISDPKLAVVLNTSVK